MSHADSYVRNIQAELQQLGFSVSDCIVIREDDPQHTWGIAWYFGRDSSGCGHMSYDVGYLPSKHTVVHEFGHDMHSKWQGDDILDRLWVEVGFPVSTDQAIEAGRASGSQYGYWQRTPAEMLADLFAWCVLGDYIQTEMFGVPLTDALRFKLQAFFRSFKEEDVALSDADRATIQASIDASTDKILSRLGTMEVDILREVLGKLQSGFNVSVPTFIDRQTAGDTKVATAEKE